METMHREVPHATEHANATITLAGGCFWCLEAVFREVRGVVDVECGYSNGTQEQASYDAVCTGQTGYAEVVRIEFDPAMVSLEQLLDIFFASHDPTSLNGQGADIGTQYRSAIFCSSDAQQRQVMQWLDEARRHYAHPVRTEVARCERYHRAEEYHQRYFENHPYQGYCAVVVAPKVDAFRQAFPEWQRTAS